MKNTKFIFVMGAIFLIYFAVLYAAFSSYTKYERTVIESEEVMIMPVDYLDSSYDTSERFTIGKYTDNWNNAVYEFYEQQNDGSYKLVSKNANGISVVKDLDEGETPYLTRDVLRNGEKQNTVLHLPKETDIVYCKK